MARRKKDEIDNPTEAPPVEKPKRTRKPTKKKAAEMVEEKDALVKMEEPQDGVEWTADLTWELLTAIYEDAVIKRGLFPGPGQNASTTKGGGKKKTDHQYALAKALFSEHPLYSAAFLAAKAPKEMLSWGNKIKNRLRTLTLQTKAHMAAMGETGAGLMQEELEALNATHPLYNRWQLVKQDSPWFTKMRDLVAERPNLNPTGVGNSASEVDLSLLASGTSSGRTSPDLMELDEEDAVKKSAKRSFADDADLYDSSDDEGPLPPSLLGAEHTSVPPVAPPKCKFDAELRTDDDDGIDHKPGHGSASSGHGKTPARPSTISSATAPPSVNPKKKQAAKKLKLSEEFADVAKAEERTRQKELDVQRMHAEVNLAKVKAKGDRMKLQAEMQMKALEQKHQLRMEKLRLQHAHGHAALPIPTFGHDILTQGTLTSSSEPLSAYASSCSATPPSHIPSFSGFGSQYISSRSATPSTGFSYATLNQDLAGGSQIDKVNITEADGPSMQAHRGEVLFQMTDDFVISPSDSIE
ncbi:hypothetical protein BKA93DRAFT_752137 [Sparassis latifolia]